LSRELNVMGLPQNTKTQTEIDSKEAFDLKLDKLSNERQIEEILTRLGSRKFGKADLRTCRRQLKDLGSRISSAISSLDTYINDLNHYRKPSVIEGISTEAMENIQKELWEFALIMREMSMGKEAEGKLLPISERNRPQSLN
jgi:hypothetical protein